MPEQPTLFPTEAFPSPSGVPSNEVDVTEHEPQERARLAAASTSGWPHNCRVHGFQEGPTGHAIPAATPVAILPAQIVGGSGMLVPQKAHGYRMRSMQMKSQMGALIANAMQKVRRDGVVTLAVVTSTVEMLDLVRGMRFDRGLCSQGGSILCQAVDCQGWAA